MPGARLANGVEMVRAAGGQMVSMQPCRLTDPAECGELVELAVSESGRIDVLFNLAATSYLNWLEHITDQEWDRARLQPPGTDATRTAGRPGQHRCAEHRQRRAPRPARASG